MSLASGRDLCRRCSSLRPLSGPARGPPSFKVSVSLAGGQMVPVCSSTSRRPSSLMFRTDFRALSRAAAWQGLFSFARVLILLLQSCWRGGADNAKEADMLGRGSELCCLVPREADGGGNSWTARVSDLLNRLRLNFCIDSLILEMLETRKL